MQDTFAYTTAFFRMKLGGIVIIFMQGSAEWEYVICYGSGTIINRDIETVYEIDKLLFRKTFEKVAVRLRNRVPSHVRHLIFMFLRDKTFHINIKNTQALPDAL